MTYIVQLILFGPALYVNYNLQSEPCESNDQMRIICPRLPWSRKFCAKCDDKHNLIYFQSYLS